MNFANYLRTVFFYITPPLAVLNVRKNNVNIQPKLNVHKKFMFDLVWGFQKRSLDPHKHLKSEMESFTTIVND